jgi:hypothetical protein
MSSRMPDPCVRQEAETIARGSEAAMVRDPS